MIVFLNNRSRVFRTFNLIFVCGRHNVPKIMNVETTQNNMPKQKLSNDALSSVEIVAASGSNNIDRSLISNKRDPRQDSRRHYRRARSEESISLKTNVNFQTQFFINPVGNVLQYGVSSIMASNAGFMPYPNFCTFSPHYPLSYTNPEQQILSQHYFHRCSSAENRQGKDCLSKNNDLLSSCRFWEDVSTENKRTKGKSRPGFFFSLMSYNVLAQDLIHQHPELYRVNNPKFLKWETRWNNLFEEIKKLQPDILCLQEVQESHIYSHYSSLETLGYKGLFKKRTGLRTDGCAIYYKFDNVNLVEYATVEFYQPNVAVLNRDNVAIISKFSPKLHPTREFLVATTHLLYNPRRHDVRLAQTQLLLTEIERMSFKVSREDSSSKYLPVILTGDLNSYPTSAVYKFITKGELNYEDLYPRRFQKHSISSADKELVPSCLRITDNCQHADLLDKRLNKEVTNRAEEHAIIKLHHSDYRNVKNTVEIDRDSHLFGSGTLSHLFAFKSAYNHGEGENAEGTSFQDEWVTVDYIFYSGKKENENIEEDKLKLISRYRLPTVLELDNTRIPNNVFGSDHISLVVKLKMEF